ncbi:hypothetical protein AURDEDRAFT_171525 [Auricularia subglabra TFB-10046 SS5]|nr:hypothetical protein AURDEDRAFT_171525 [Auricularia subglabra TFB-10046 SS5]
MLPKGILCGIVDHPVDFVFNLSILLDDYEDCHVSTVDDIARLMDLAHAWCDCGKKLSKSVWRANLPFGWDLNAGLAWFKPEDAELLDGHAAVEHVIHDSPSHAIHLMTKTVLPPERRSEVFTQAILRLYGDACRVVGSHELLLPETGDFNDIWTRPGCFYVDKTLWYRARYDGDGPCKLAIIRRGPGYGKSSVLSAVAAWYDAFYDTRHFPPKICAFEISQTPTFVLSLDFARLQVDAAGTDGDTLQECNRFMMEAVSAFCGKYAQLLSVPEPSPTPDDADQPYEMARSFATAYKHKIFLAIDNYTSPFLNLAPEQVTRIEKLIHRQILANIFVDVELGFVFRGFITGSPLPTADIPLPFTFSPVFERFTEDLTDLPDFEKVIGITGEDVRELLRSFVFVHSFGMDDAHVEQIAARWDKERTYPARDVIATLRHVQVDHGRLATPAGLPEECPDALRLPVSASTGSTWPSASVDSAMDVLQTLDDHFQI